MSINVGTLARVLGLTQERAAIVRSVVVEGMSEEQVAQELGLRVEEVVRMLEDTATMTTVETRGRYL